jgi:hypothetical protein
MSELNSHLFTQGIVLNAWEIVARTCSISMYRLGFRLNHHIVGRLGNWWLVWCLVSNKVEVGGHDTWGFCSFFDQFVYFFIAKYVCVCPNFANDDNMGRCFYCIYDMSGWIVRTDVWCGWVLGIFYSNPNLTIQFIEFTYCNDRFSPETLEAKNNKYKPLIDSITSRGWKVDPLL